MTNNLLLPNKYKRIGWFILAPAAVLGITMIFRGFDWIHLNSWVFAFFDDESLGLSHSFSFIYTNIVDTVVGILFIAGALLVGFSREKNEDEFIASLRQTSLLWAILVNYVLLLFCFVFIYGTAFLSVMLYNIFTVLVIFIIRFNYVLHRNSKSMPVEKYN